MTIKVLRIFNYAWLEGPVQCLGCGEGGLDDLKNYLDDSMPMYGLFRVSHTDDNDMTTVKFVYIVW